MHRRTEAIHRPETALPAHVPGLRPVAVSLAILLITSLPASAQLAMSAFAIAGGGGRSSSAGHCLRIEATLGQALAGTASAGAFTITSGYWAGIDSRSRDSLFNTGFEECL
jgi:hypothetical protein